MKRHIPNIITCLNVVCGSLAIMMALYGYILYAAIFILLGMFFDFFDGLAARLLHVKSEMGKELDSLADMVTFGVAPALLAHFLLKEIIAPEPGICNLLWYEYILLFLPVLIPAFSAYRLAKFNLDKRQTTSFIGLPVPAHALFWVALVWACFYIPEYYQLLFMNVWVLELCIVILSVLLISELPMFSLKFENLKWRQNKTRYIFFILLTGIFLAFGKVGVVFIIPLYIFICALRACLMAFKS